MIAPRWAFRLLWAIDRRIDRWSGGRSDSWRPGPKTLRVTTVGRRSGEPRVNGVYYVDVEGGWAVVPSHASSRREPGWWLNLQANRDATVRVATREHPIRARRASEEEELRLWPRLEGANAAYREYRAVPGRSVPIVLLERKNDA